MNGKHALRSLFRVLPLLTVVTVIAVTQKHQPAPLAAHPSPPLAKPAATPAILAVPRQVPPPQSHVHLAHLAQQHLLAVTVGHAGPRPRPQLSLR